MSNQHYYTYILFDWLGIPRYVGKGKGNRWFRHEQRTDTSNQLKNEFIEQTWIMLEEIPKIKIAENMTNVEACILETLLINTIGRQNTGTGTLVNLTDGGEGIPGYAHQNWAKIIISERSASWNASLEPEVRAARARHATSHLTPEQRSANARLGGLLSKQTADYKAMALRGAQAWYQNTTPEQRSESRRRGELTKKRNGTRILVGYRWMTNGVEQKHIPAATVLPEGWWY